MSSTMFSKEYSICRLYWEKSYDTNDNTIYLAYNTFWSDGFIYRITPILIGDKIHYTLEKSDFELGICSSEVFDTVCSAKLYCEEHNDLHY